MSSQTLHMHNLHQWPALSLQGVRRAWQDLSDSVWNWRDTAAGQPAPRNTAISKRRRFEAVSKVVQQLPVELHASEEDLRQMSLPELKVTGSSCPARLLL